MPARAQNQPASAIAASAPEVGVQDLEKSSAARQDDDLQIRLDEAERVARDLQAEVSFVIGNAHPMHPDNPRAIALREARDRATELRTAFYEKRAALDRESLATVAFKFAECSRTFGAESGPNGWASCSDVPPEALAACFDSMIVALAADQVSVPRMFNQIRDKVERAVPPACLPFLPCELFGASSIRSAIIERIRQMVKDPDVHPHAQQMETTVR